MPAGTVGERVRWYVRVEGIVQGVGFRPFIHALALRFGLDGLVGNDPQGVFIEVEGAEGAASAFLEAVTAEAPPLAVIESVVAERIEPVGERGFAIVASQAGGERQALISPDTATCAECRAEVHDPSDRRYRYPFTNCTNCGPRFTIVTGVPYDRPLTTMAGFPMCPACAAEYHDPFDRRFHAQPVCCPDCGPRLALCDAQRRPLPRRPAAGLASPVPRGTRFIGVMLPYTPLHDLLAGELGVPFVLTSGNVSDEPIAYRDDDAFERLAGIADSFLVHDRPIHVRTDDSVVRAFRGRPLLVRRSRGYAPQPGSLSS